MKKSWHEWNGDRDLYEKWGYFQLSYKGDISPYVYEIIAIYRDGTKLITVNAREGSFPLCEKTEKENVLKIKNGHNCDELILLTINELRQTQLPTLEELKIDRKLLREGYQPILNNLREMQKLLEEIMKLL